MRTAPTVLIDLGAALKLPWWPGDKLVESIRNEFGFPYGDAVEGLELLSFRGETDIETAYPEILSDHLKQAVGSGNGSDELRIILVHPFRGHEDPSSADLKRLIENTSEEVHRSDTSRAQRMAQVFQLVWMPARQLTSDSLDFFGAEWFDNVFCTDYHTVFLFSDLDEQNKRIAPEKSATDIQALVKLLVGMAEPDRVLPQILGDYSNTAEPQFFDVGTRVARVPLLRMDAFLKNRLEDVAITEMGRSESADMESKEPVAVAADLLVEELAELFKDGDEMRAGDREAPFKKIIGFEAATSKPNRGSKSPWNLTEKSSSGFLVPLSLEAESQERIQDHLTNSVSKLQTSFHQTLSQLREKMPARIAKWWDKVPDEVDRASDFRTWQAAERAFSIVAKNTADELESQQRAIADRAEAQLPEQQFWSDMQQENVRLREEARGALKRLVPPFLLVGVLVLAVFGVGAALQPGVFPYIAERLEGVGLSVARLLWPGQSRDLYQVVEVGRGNLARQAGVVLTVLLFILSAITVFAGAVRRKQAVSKILKEFRENREDLAERIISRFVKHLDFTERSKQMAVLSVRKRFIDRMLRRVSSVHLEIQRLRSRLEGRAQTIGYRLTAHRGIVPHDSIDESELFGGGIEAWFKSVESTLTEDTVPYQKQLLGIMEKKVNERLGQLVKTDDEQEFVRETIGEVLDGVVLDSAVREELRNLILLIAAAEAKRSPGWPTGSRIPKLPLPISSGESRRFILRNSERHVPFLAEETGTNKSSIEITWCEFLDPVVQELKVRHHRNAEAVFGKENQ